MPDEHLRILKVDRLAPGTLVVDDSAPHCFDKQEMIRRLTKRGDVLFTEGGVLEPPQPITESATCLLSSNTWRRLAARRIRGC